MVAHILNSAVLTKLRFGFLLFELLLLALNFAVLTKLRPGLLLFDFKQGADFQLGCHKDSA